MVNTISTALSGLLSAKGRVDQSADNIAKASTGLSDSYLPKDIVDIKIASVEFKANLAVIKTANEMTDQLLKTFDEKV